MRVPCPVDPSHRFTRTMLCDTHGAVFCQACGTHLGLIARRRDGTVIFTGVDEMKSRADVAAALIEREAAYEREGGAA